MSKLQPPLFHHVGESLLPLKDCSPNELVSGEEYVYGTPGGEIIPVHYLGVCSGDQLGLERSVRLSAVMTDVNIENRDGSVRILHPGDIIYCHLGYEGWMTSWRDCDMYLGGEPIVVPVGHACSLLSARGSNI